MSEPSKPWDMSNPTWLIHKTWAGESSARVLLFTRDQGLIWAKCHGGWGLKKQAMLQAFTPLWIELTQRQTWYYVRHMEIAGSAFEFTGIYLFSALYINELLYHALRPQDPYSDLYDAYVTTLPYQHGLLWFCIMHGHMIDRRVFKQHSTLYADTRVLVPYFGQ